MAELLNRASNELNDDAEILKEHDREMEAYLSFGKTAFEALAMEAPSSIEAATQTDFVTTGPDTHGNPDERPTDVDTTKPSYI